MLRVAAFNVNGIRAAARRGFRSWLEHSHADVVCLQEVRARPADIPVEVFDGYTTAYHEGNQPGRAGVAVLTRTEPTDVRIGFKSAEFDQQGRYIEVDLPGITVASVYLPKGDLSGEIYDTKMRFMAEFAAHTAKAARKARRAKREFLVCGDYNIAHTESDIKSWKANLKSAGFLPEERAWMGQLTSAGGLVDVVRKLHPDQVGPYSWWSWRGKAFDLDSGWRIDHQLATPGLARLARASWIDKADSYAERISDHAAVLVDYDL